MRDAERVKLDPEQNRREDFAAGTSTIRRTPDPTCSIRTGGESRISNFLLWQIAYSEIYNTDVMWPEFRKSHLVEAIADYQSRERRFGLTSQQVRGG